MKILLSVRAKEWFRIDFLGSRPRNELTVYLKFNMDDTNTEGHSKQGKLDLSLE